MELPEELTLKDQDNPYEHFLTEDAGASDPGRFRYSERLLRHMAPELFQESSWDEEQILKTHREAVAGALSWGDTRAAVVVLTDPVFVAAYTDEIDSVALLGFGDRAEGRGLKVGDRLVTCNIYGYERAPDLKTGRNAHMNFSNFTPVIADFHTPDLDAVEARKASIRESEWKRCLKLGLEAVERRQPVRNGRGAFAADPGLPWSEPGDDDWKIKAGLGAVGVAFVLQLLRVMAGTGSARVLVLIVILAGVGAAIGTIYGKAKA